MLAAELSRMTGVSTGRLSKLGQGKGQLRLPEALRMARALGVTVDYLADETATDADIVSIEESRYLLRLASDVGYPEAKRRLLGIGRPAIEALPPIPRETQKPVSPPVSQPDEDRGGRRSGTG